VADTEKSYQWLKKAGLNDSTEALIMPAQDQALRTRAIEAGSAISDRTPGVGCAKRLMRQSSRE